MNQETKKQFEALSIELEKFPPHEVTSAFNALGTKHLRAYFQGVKAYQTHPFKRQEKPHEIVWQDGTTKLLRVGGKEKNKTPILIVPSLINRYYILDLLPEYSFLDALTAQGFSVYVIDWDAPGATEKDFTLSDYITRIQKALEDVTEQTSDRAILIGYCMGGMLTTALCQLLPQKIKAHVALATPWDFSGPFPLWSMCFKNGADSVAAFLNQTNQLPADIIQSLFWSLDPQGAKNKFEKFAATPQDSAEAKLFVALEDWLNDNVPLVREVAKECLLGWYGNNAPLEGKWIVNGTAIELKKITTPTYVMIPQNDKIVPPASALPLAAELMSRVKASPPLGHIGLMVSRNAAKLAWDPLFQWLKQYVKAP